METKIKHILTQVLIITRAETLDQDWIDALRTESGIELLACVGVLGRGVEAVQQLKPQVVVIDRSAAEIEATLNDIYAFAPHTICVGVLAEHEAASMRRLMVAGARDVLTVPLQATEILTSLREVVRLDAARRERAGLPAPQRERRATADGKVIVVMGAKGGVGSTTIASNVAVALQQVSGKEVALADFSLQFGDAAALLNVWSRHTLHDLAVHYQTLDASLLNRVLTAHGSGVKVLQAPALPEQAAEVQGPQVEAIVKLLRSHFAYVVVDCWSFLDEITETLIANADHVMMVTTPEVPALKNTKRALDYFMQHGAHSEKLAVVLNRFPSIKGVTLREIEAHLGRSVEANLPSDGHAVAYAVNRGVPFVQDQPKSWVAQSCFKIAAALAGEHVSMLSEGPAAPATAKPQSKRRFVLKRASA